METLKENSMTFFACDKCLDHGPLDLCIICLHNRNVIDEYARMLAEEKAKKVKKFDPDETGVVALFSLMLLAVCIASFCAYISVNFGGIEESHCSRTYQKDTNGNWDYSNPVDTRIKTKVELDDGTTRWLEKQINCR